MNRDPSVALAADISDMAHLKQLYRQGLFRQALNTAEQAWGPWRQVDACERRIFLARTLSNLGLTRSSDALLLRTWRQNRDDVQARYYYLRTIARRHGAFIGLQRMQAMIEPDALSCDTRAEWLGFKANLYAQYRDWPRAQTLLTQAKALGSESFWLAMEEAYVLEKQDRYQDALNAIEPLALHHHYCPAILLSAYLYALLGRQDEAVTLLHHHAQRMESVPLYLQLYAMFQEYKVADGACWCIEQARALIPEDDQALGEELAISAFSLAYLEEDMSAALTALEHVRTPYYRLIKKNMEQADLEDQPVLLEVPFVRQHHMTCAPATLTAISHYWAQSAEHLEIVEQICYDGTPHQAERHWAEEKGWRCKEFTLNEDVAIALLDRGVPFTLSTVEPGSAHLQAVVGYDRRKGVYLLRDPYYPTLQELLIEEAGKYYASSGPRCFVLLPQEQAHLLDDITFPETQFYDRYYAVQCALKKHQRDVAEEQIRVLKEQDSGQRLTLWARRSLARYDSDYKAELDCVDALLTLYPDDLNLQADKAYLLAELGQHRAQIQFLEEAVITNHHHPHITRMLADCLRHDQRQYGQTTKLLLSILSRQPFNAAAIWSLASVYWNQESERAHAFELYRLCASLEDKNEQYISSYFKAARYFKKTDEALDTLRKRVADLGERSANPYVSLYHALSAVSRDPEAIAILEEAKVKHGDDSYLLKTLLEAYLYNGMFDKMVALHQQAKSYLSRIEWLYLAAQLFRYRNEPKKERDCYQKILREQPLHYGVITAYVELLSKYYDVEDALKFIDNRLAISPNDKRLLTLRLDKLSERPDDSYKKYLNEFIERFANDSEAHLRLARYAISSRDLDTAHRSIEQALNIAPESVEAHTLLGDLYVLQGESGEAKACFKKAISLFADAPNVFSKLLDCCNSIEEKQNELVFIHQALMEQTSYGTGILAYKDCAINIIDDEHLLGFLKQAVEIRPDLWHAWVALSSYFTQTGRVDQAMSYLNTAVSRFPLEPRVWLERANTHFVAQSLALVRPCSLRC